MGLLLFADNCWLVAVSPAELKCMARAWNELLEKAGLVRSTLGLTDVPARVVEQKSVAAMQHELQCLLKFRAANREGNSFGVSRCGVCVAALSVQCLRHDLWCGWILSMACEEACDGQGTSSCDPMRGQREDASMLSPLRGSEGNGMEAKVDGRQASWKSSVLTMSSQTWSLLVGILYSKSHKIEFTCGS